MSSTKHDVARGGSGHLSRYPARVLRPVFDASSIESPLVVDHPERRENALPTKDVEITPVQPAQDEAGDTASLMVLPNTATVLHNSMVVIAQEIQKLAQLSGNRELLNVSEMNRFRGYIDALSTLQDIQQNMMRNTDTSALSDEELLQLGRKAIERLEKKR